MQYTNKPQFSLSPKVIIGLLVLGAALAAGIYVCQQNKLQQEHTAQKNSVVDAAKAYCQARVTDIGQPYYFETGTIKGEQVVYTKDRTFAFMNIRCTPKPADHGGIQYTLKKVNNVWVVVIADIEDNAAQRRLYGVPEPTTD